MYHAIAERKIELTRLCVRHRVRCMALFGSAATDRFDPKTGDLDFLVEFYPMPPAEHAASYFGLMEQLELLFDLPIDLVEAAPLRNPYVLKAIAAGRVELYDAA